MKDKDSDVRKRKHLTPEEKYQIFIESIMAKAQGNGGISQVLRRWSIHSSDLTRIKRTVEEGAISSFKARAERRRQARVKRIEFNRNQNCLHEDSYRQVDQTEWAKAA